MVLSKEYPDNKNYIIYSDGRSNIIAAGLTPTVFVGNM